LGLQADRRDRVSVATEMVEDIVRQTLRTRCAEVERVALGYEVREAPQSPRLGR
jgi:hypothetical protein